MRKVLKLNENDIINPLNVNKLSQLLFTTFDFVNNEDMIATKEVFGTKINKYIPVFAQDDFMRTLWCHTSISKATLNKI